MLTTEWRGHGEKIVPKEAMNSPSGPLLKARLYFIKSPMASLAAVELMNEAILTKCNSTCLVPDFIFLIFIFMLMDV